MRRIKLPLSFLLFCFHPEPNGSGVALPGEGTPKLVVVIQRPFQVPPGGVGDFGLVAHEGDDLAVGCDGQHGPDIVVWVTQLRAPLCRAGVSVVIFALETWDLVPVWFGLNRTADFYDCYLFAGWNDATRCRRRAGGSEVKLPA